MNYLWKKEFDWTSEYTYSVTEWTRPTLGTQTSGPDAWLNLSSLLNSNNFSTNVDTNATFLLQEQSPNMIILSGFNFGVQLYTGTTIVGIETRFSRYFVPTITVNPVGGITEPVPSCGYADFGHDYIIAINKSYNSGFTTNLARSFAPLSCGAEGNWNNQSTLVTYGSATELWGQTWTITDINSGNLALKIQPQYYLQPQYLDPGTGIDTTTHGGQFYIGSPEVRIHYLTPRTVSAISYRQVDRVANRTVDNTHQAYYTPFSYHLCQSPYGICYSYVNSLDNIYNVSLLTGDGNNINNMYNEYAISREYLSNSYLAELALNTPIDLTKPYFELDNFRLIPGHKILLYAQTSATTNDIYVVTNNYYLENSNLLATRAQAWRAKVTIMSGSAKEKEFFLLNAGNQFPIRGEAMTFIEGHSYILKNRFHYNLNNTATYVTYDVDGNIVSQPSALLFSNYEVARRMGTALNFNTDRSDYACPYAPVAITTTFGSNASMVRSVLEQEPTLRLQYLDETHDIILSGERKYFCSGTTHIITGYTTTIVTATTSFSAQVYTAWNIEVGDVLLYRDASFEAFYPVTTAVFGGGYWTVTLEGLYRGNYQPGTITVYVLRNTRLGTELTVQTAAFGDLTRAGDAFRISCYNGLVVNEDELAFEYFTNVLSATTHKLILPPIPEYILRDLQTLPEWCLQAQNLQFASATTAGLCKMLTYSPLGSLLDVIDNPTNSGCDLKPKFLRLYDRYFDFSLVTLTTQVANVTQNTYTFTNENQYLNYDLGTFLKRLDAANFTDQTVIYHQTYLLTGQFTVSAITRQPDVAFVRGATPITRDQEGFGFRIYPLPNYLNTLAYFLPFTYVDLGRLQGGSLPVLTPPTFTSYSGRTLITEVTATYLTLEVPMNFVLANDLNGTISKLLNCDVINVCTLSAISSCLQDVYTNYTHVPYYYKQPANRGAQIGEAYAQVIRANDTIRAAATGIIYHQDGDFNLDLFTINLNV